MRTPTATTSARHEKEEEVLQNRIKDFFKQDKISSFHDVQKKISDLKLPENVSVIQEETSVSFLCILWEDIPSIQYGLKICEDLSMKMTVQGQDLRTEKVSHLLQDMKLGSATDICNILAHLQAMVGKKEEQLENFVQNCASAIEHLCSPETSTGRKLLFLREQMILAITPVRSRRFSNDLLAAATMWKVTSPSLYKQLVKENILTLPSYNHLQSLGKDLNVGTGVSSSTVTYLKARSEKLSERERLVVLLIDEIYSAQRVEYAGGKIFGLDAEGRTSKTLLSFMIKAAAGQYCDVVALHPIVNLDSTLMKKKFEEVMEAVSAANFEVVAISVDNASPNRKFFIQELGKGLLSPSISHPLSSAPIHLLFDSTHNFKNIYNNFQTRRSFALPAPKKDPQDTEKEKEKEELRAEFSHIEELYKKELGKPVKLAYKLSEKVLHPTAIEKTNVLLADSLFHHSTIQALNFYSSEHPAWQETAAFLQLIRDWWNVVNVKTPFLGQKKRNPYQEPISSVDDHNMTALKNFGDFLKKWKAMSSGKRNKGGLTNETFLAVGQSTSALIHLATFLLEEKGFLYVLLGQVQSDPLEKRFGWYRQLGGSNYFISVRQILEAEKTIRLRSLVKFSGYSLAKIRQQFEEDETDEKKRIKEDAEALLTLLPREENLTSLALDDKSVLFYVGGYLAHSLSKILRCKECVQMLQEEKEAPIASLPKEEEDKEHRQFIDEINRGGLLYPSDIVFVSSIHIWSFFKEVTENQEAKKSLLQSTHPRQVFVGAFMTTCQKNEDTEPILVSTCKEGHPFDQILVQMAGKLFNMFAKNVCSDVNARQHKEVKRKGPSSTGATSSAAKIKKLQSL